MRLATFNTFFLGTPETHRIRRTVEDEAAIVELVRRLDADVLLLQEAVHLPYVESLLQRVRRGRYRMKDAQGRWLTTGRMRSRVSRLQKIALAWDPLAVELVTVLHAFAGRWPGPREPLALRFRSRNGRLDLTLVGVHLKSDGTALLAGGPPAQVRRAECEALCGWLLGAGGERRPTTDAVVVMGDFNAGPGDRSLAAMRRRLRGWTWQRPAFEPDVPGERWTSYGERSVIDQVVTSPAASRRVTGPPRVLAFDLDPAFDRPAGGRGTGHFLRSVTDLEIRPDDDLPATRVENIYRISDHRPLVVELR